MTAHPPLDEDMKLMNVYDVAAIFSVNPKTVTRWAAAGKLPFVRTPGGQLRFRRDDVAEALHRSTDLAQE